MSNKPTLTPPEGGTMLDGGSKPDGLWYARDDFSLTIEADGIRAEDSKGNTELIHRFGICPTRVVVARDGDGEETTLVTVKFSTVTGEVRQLTIPLGDLNSFSPRDELVKEGWPLPAGNARKTRVASILLEVLAEAVLPRVDGYSVCGWVQGRDGERVHVRPGNPLYVGNTPDQQQQAGTFDAWADAFRALIADSPLFALCAAASFGSYLRGALPEKSGHTPIVLLYGEKGHGKTTIAAACASIQGNPGKRGLVFDGASSRVGIEGFLAANNHGFLAVDELDEVLRNASKNGGLGAAAVMFYTNGGGRAKGDGQGGVTIGQTWLSLIIGTANVRLTELSRDDMKAAAIANRLVELDILDEELHTFYDRARVAGLMSTLQENHGHAYPLAIDEIKANLADYREAFNDYYSELTQDPTLKHFDHDRRFAEFVALTFVGAQLMGKVVGDDAQAAATDALDVLLSRYRQAEDDMVQRDRVKALGELETLKEFIKLNAARFIWRDYAYRALDGNELHMGEVERERARIEAQRAEARFLTEKAQAGALGEVRLSRPMNDPDDFVGEVRLSVKGEKELADRAGLSGPELRSAAAKFGVLRSNEAKGQSLKINGAKQVALMGSDRVTCIILRPIALAELESRPAPVPSRSGLFPYAGTHRGADPLAARRRFTMDELVEAGAELSRFTQDPNDPDLFYEDEDGDDYPPLDLPDDYLNELDTRGDEVR